LSHIRALSCPMKRGATAWGPATTNLHKPRRVSASSMSVAFVSHSTSLPASPIIGYAAVHEEGNIHRFGQKISPSAILDDQTAPLMA
jgi:hypothetical protein